MLENEKIQFWVFAPGLSENIEFNKNVCVCKKNLKQIAMITIQQRRDRELYLRYNIWTNIIHQISLIHDY
jgi:hypothetical protein